MAKNDKQQLFNESTAKIKQSEGDYGQEISKSEGRGDTTWDRASSDYAGASKGYNDYAQGAGLTQADTDRMRAAWNNPVLSGQGSGGGGGWGGITNPLAGKSSAYEGLSSAFANAYRPDYAEADTGFRKLSGASGGFDQGQLDQIYGNTKTLTDIGQTGGITDEDKANINRASILEQERTGGYSDQDRALIRAKSAASSPAYFSALKDNMERQRSATGNLANAGAMDFKLARQGAQQQGQDRMAAEQGLQDQIRQGKQQAGQFLSGQGMQLAGLRTANQLQGARSAGDLGLNTQMGITANQAQGLRGLQESQTGLGQWGLGQAGGLDQFGLGKAGGLDTFTGNQAQLDMQAQMANAQGAAAGSAGSAASARQAARDQAEFEQWLTQYGNEQKQYGIGGLTDLYGTNLDSSKGYSDLAANQLNNKFDTQGMLLGYATQNRGATAMENAGSIANMVGAATGAATGVMTGGASTALKGLAGQNVKLPKPPKA
jgi:hypothetical protein